MQGSTTSSLKHEATGKTLRINFTINLLGAFTFLANLPIIIRVECKKGLQMTEAVAQQVECRRCGHKWTPRTASPKVCPRCKHYDWNTWGVEYEVEKKSQEQNKEGGVE